MCGLVCPPITHAQMNAKERDSVKGGCREEGDRVKERVRRSVNPIPNPEPNPNQVP
jgi:hypothetical protein